MLAVEPGYVDHITQQSRFLDCLECAEQLLHQTLSGVAGRFDVNASDCLRTVRGSTGLCFDDVHLPAAVAKPQAFAAQLGRDVERPVCRRGS